MGSPEQQPNPSWGGGLTHLLVLNLEGGQSGLQLVVPHEQLRLDGLLGADLAHLQKRQPPPALAPAPTSAEPGPAAPASPSAAAETGLGRLRHPPKTTQPVLGHSGASQEPGAAFSQLSAVVCLPSARRVTVDRTH